MSWTVWLGLVRLSRDSEEHGQECQPLARPCTELSRGGDQSRGGTPDRPPVHARSHAAQAVFWEVTSSTFHTCALRHPGGGVTASWWASSSTAVEGSWR